MKSKLIAAFVLASCYPASAVIVTLDNGGFSQAVVDTSNTAIPVGGGIVALGYFQTYTSSTIFGSLTGADLAADFVIFGNTSNFAGVGFEGFYLFDADGGRVGAASPFLGQNLITLVGNGDSIASSTQALIYQHNTVWPNDDGAPTPASLTAVLGDSGVENYWHGGPTGGTTSILGTDIPAVMMAPIPEPSAALLGLVGALGLLRRRRN